MNHCVVPSWDLQDNSAPSKLSLCAPSNSSNSLPTHVPSLEYEVAELTWENGQLAMHGLGPPRGVNKSAAAAASPHWEKPRAAAGTLESIVSQATTCHANHNPAAVGGCDNSYELQVPWFDHNRAAATANTNANLAAAASTCITMTMDALVPCQGNNDNNNSIKEKSVPCKVGSCSGAAAVAAAKGGHAAARRGMCGCRTNASVSESATCGGGGGRDSRQVTFDGFTSTSLWSPENTSSGGGEYTRTSADELDHSVCHSRPQKETGDHEGKRKLGVGKSSTSTKRSRAAAIHNQSERKRRDKINQRMKTLQKLVPNCSKTDKASMLDEVIEYLKQLQAQVQMMSRINMPSMMLPLALQQQLQMSMMAPAMGMGMGMGMGVMDINPIGRAATGMPPPATGMPPATAFVPMPSWDVPADRLSSTVCMPNDILSALLACQSQQPMTMDAYSRLAALYQQFQQPQGSGSKN